MDDLIPTVVRCRLGDTTVEVRHCEISDVFRQLWFGPVSELELPDAKASDEQFQDWLDLYRHSSKWFGVHLLEEAKCD